MKKFLGTTSLSLVLVLSGCSLSGTGIFPSEGESGSALSIGLRASPVGHGGGFGFTGDFRFYDVDEVVETGMHANALWGLTRRTYLLGGGGLGSGQGLDWTAEVGIGGEIDIDGSGGDNDFDLFLDAGWAWVQPSSEDEDVDIDPLEGPFVRIGIAYCIDALLMPC